MNSEEYMNCSHKESVIYKNADTGYELFIYSFKMLQNRKNEFFSYLTTEEKRILDQTHSLQRANEILFGRGLLRYSLSKRIDMEPKNIDIRTTQYGKPYLHTDLPLTLYFSVSHSFGVIGIAFSKQLHVGFDIERIDDSLELNALAPIFMTEKELHIWKTRTSNNIDLFFTYWTQKEACLKCEGIGYLKEPREHHISDFICQKHFSVASGECEIDYQIFSYSVALKQQSP